MATHISKVSMAGFFRDVDGVLTDTKRCDDIVPFTWDLRDGLDGETIASVAYDERGVDVTNETNTTTVVTCDVGLIGSLEVTVTDSAGRIHQEIFQWVDSGVYTGGYS